MKPVFRSGFLPCGEKNEKAAERSAAGSGGDEEAEAANAAGADLTHFLKWHAICLSVLVVCSTTACSRISLTKQPGDSRDQKAPHQLGDQPLSGRWRTGFQVGDKAMQASMTLVQHGNNFEGEGNDDRDGKAFKIEQGHITGNQITFYKHYGDGSSIEYAGTFKMVNANDYQGPYMSGQYTTASNGGAVVSNWEAEKDFRHEPQPIQMPFISASPKRADSKPATLWPTDRAPDLSGKWEVAYEYNFKTIHSIMYIETDNGKVTGHGHDINTQEKFTIERGWYHFPRLTIIRKYLKGQGAGKGAVVSRTMTFKGTVSIVNEADYSGPWIKGKTQGGGNWEAQLIK